LSEEVSRSLGRKFLLSFSKNVDLNRIWLICLLGSGAFAQVYLVKKEEEPCTVKGIPYSTYFAMKVLNKKLIREKDYLDFIKLEKHLT